MPFDTIGRRDKRGPSLEARDAPAVPVDVSAYGQRAAEILGVQGIFRRRMGSPVAVHEVLHAGLPSRALLKVMQTDIAPPLLLEVFGVSLRTFMRLKADPSRPLGPEQSSRVWQFAEIMAKAEDVLGSTDRAVDWMLRPAIALENRRPIDLLTTSIGAQLVDDVIERMRHGVYQ